MRTSTLFVLLSIASISYSQHDHGRSSLEFIENHKQWNEDVLYRCALSNGAVFLESNCFTYSFLDPSGSGELHDLQFASKEDQDAYLLKGHAWKMHFLGANEAEVSGGQKTPHYYNFFLGDSQEKWSSRVSGYGEVNYRELYEGISIAIGEHDGHLKYDFIIEPQGDPSMIQLQFEGLMDIQLVEGQLELTTQIGKFYESAPYTYQHISGKKVEVSCEYELNGDRVSFSFPDGYDSNHPLIIDPELIAATLSGTTGFESNFGHSAAFDIEGNIFTGCVASGSGYPTTVGAFDQTYGGGIWDIGISKLNPEGTDLLWATFLGGASSDYPHSMIANNGQELYVYGSSSSSDYPTTNTAYQPDNGGGTDIVISHLSADGATLIGSTFLGGTETDGQNTNSQNYGDTYRGEIFLDYDNDPIIASSSNSTNFPVLGNAYQTVHGGQQDAVVVKLNPSLSSLSVSTYIGGPNDDTGYGIRTALDGSLYICGGAGDGFPTTAGAYHSDFQGPTGGFTSLDGFIAKFNETGSSLIASTYHGTEDNDQAFFIDLDFDEDVFVYGQGGPDMPVTDGVFNDADGDLFITKFDQDLSTVLVGTTIGGGGFGSSLVPDAFLVDNCDNIYISGYNASGDLLATNDALFDNGGFYLAVYEAELADIVFGTFYTEDHVDGGTSRFDKNGIVYQGVCSGGGFSTTADAWATDQDPGWDIGVFKINFDASGVNAAVAANDISGCAPFEITFENYSIGDQFYWDFGDGNTSTEYEPTYIYDEPGVYTVSLIAMDSLSCNLADTSFFDISISTPQDFTPSFDYEVDCVNQSVHCTNTTNLDFLDYFWDMGDGNTLEDYDADYTYDAPGDYTVTLTAVDNGCDDDESIIVDISLAAPVVAEIMSEGLEGCDELEVNFTNESINGVSFSWDFGDGSISSELEPTHVFTGPETFDVILTVTNPDACNVQDIDTVQVAVGANQVLEALFDVVQIDCVEFTVETDNQSIGENLSYQWNMGDGTILDGFDISHDYSGTGSYDVTLTISDDYCDLSDNIMVPITITTEVVATIGNGDIIGCDPFGVDFEQVGNGIATWDFGDGTAPVMGSEVSHLYPGPGLYTVTLNVVGTDGCIGIDEVTSTVEIIEPPILTPLFSISAIGECEDLSFSLTNESTGIIDSYHWEMGDGNVSTLSDLEYVYGGNGTFEISLTIVNEVCDISETISQTIQADNMLDFPAQPIVKICPEIGEVTIESEAENAEYLWFNGDTTSQITVTEPGSYAVQVNATGCWFPDLITVEQVEEMHLSKRVTLCETGSNFLVIEGEGIASYLWGDGTEDDILYISESGLYPFSVLDVHSCLHEGDIDATLLPKEPLVFVPNAFSPNEDGINDRFIPVTDDLREYELVVHNRWGDEIFRSLDANEGWNGGTQGGKDYYVPDGVYTYTITYKSNCSTERKVNTGTVTVLR